MPAESIKKETIVFPNNHVATAFFPSLQDKPKEIVTALGLGSYKAVILVLGGADTLNANLKPRLIQLFGRGIARAAAEAEAVIIDGGTQSGVMSLMGEGVADRGYLSALVGVAPASLVTYPVRKTENDILLESNHSHFVLVEGNSWSSKSAMMFDLAKALTVNLPSANASISSRGRQAAETAGTSLPKLAMLAGGGQTTKKEVLYAVRQNIPLIIFEGSGGMADEIVGASKNKETLKNDPVMAEIIEDGEIHFHSLSHSVKGVERLIIRELGADKVLMQAWETFADYDFNALAHQRKFYKIQLAILMVGVVGTALVIIQQVYAPKHLDSGDLYTAKELFKENHIGWWILRHLLILIPILLTVLVTAATRFKQGTKWLLLRAGAEAIKREIYRYRARAMYYREYPEQHLYKLEEKGAAADQQTARSVPELSAEQQLSKRIEDITLRTMRTEVNLSTLEPYDGKKDFPPYCKDSGDDGLSILTPDRYVDIRLGDQLSYFKRSSGKLDKQLKQLYWLTFIIGGVGTYLAAIDLQIWIALTTSIIGGFGTYLGYRQIENTLTKYNQAATDLANVKAWWNALSAEEQARQINIDSLVEHTEQVLQSELDGWIQQMQNALAELRKGQEVPSEREENKEPLEGAAGTKLDQDKSLPKSDGVEVAGKSNKETPSATATIDGPQTNAKSQGERNETATTVNASQPDNNASNDQKEDPGDILEDFGEETSSFSSPIKDDKEPGKYT